jgi:predicted aconitase
VPVLEEAVEELERTKAMLVEAQVAVAVATTLNPAWVDLHERIEAVVGPERA